MSITINLWLAALLYFGSLVALWLVSRPSKKHDAIADLINTEPGSVSLIGLTNTYQPWPQTPKGQVITITIDGDAIITHEQVADMMDAIRARAQE